MDLCEVFDGVLPPALLGLCATASVTASVVAPAPWTEGSSPVAAFSGRIRIRVRSKLRVTLRLTLCGRKSG